MNFKDLQYSIGKFKTDIHSQIVKSNPLQKQDTKALSLWIFQERNDLASMRTLAYERSETNKALKAWTQQECEEDKTESSRDLEDIVGDKLFRLLNKQVEVEQEFANKYQQYRHAIKSIRDKEEKLSDQREKKRSLQSRIQNLKKNSPKSPKLTEFQRELDSLAKDTHESEMDLADFKRFALKEAFYLRFNAMNEYAQKTALIAGFGKYLTDLIEIEPTPPSQINRNPYEKGPEAAIIFADAVNALENWKPSAEDERPTLANTVPSGKGKQPERAQPENVKAQPPNTPPELPPRRQTQDSIADLDANVQQPILTASEVSSRTGDLERNGQNEVDVERVDLYDGPPPAYDEHSRPDGSYDSDVKAPQSTEVHENRYNEAFFGSPLQAHSHLSPQQQGFASPQPAYINLTDSPMPMHTPLQQHWNRQDSSFYDPTNMMYNQVNYHQLYRHVSQRQQYYTHRPYTEFQQQFSHARQDTQGQQIRQRVDAGGFRIPVHEQSAEEEKQRLAQHYQNQDQQAYNQNTYQYNNHGSQYQKPATPPAPVPAHAQISHEQVPQTPEAAPSQNFHEQKTLEE
ncbi:Eisosome component PIL1-domain-containing protein [Choanephora cucurbitarum]|nr:Eisosome component PIL1-domain-containing protein [Choanephora cucurbitarum]